MHCEALFGEVHARKIRTLIESSIDEPCPCLRDLPCPLSCPLTPAESRAAGVAIAGAIHAAARPSDL